MQILSFRMFSRIVTHNDFDGLESAALCCAIHDVTEIAFTGPNAVSRAGFPVTRADIVCDLPYPGECGLWFDHHVGNAEELKRLGRDPALLPGKFAPEKSCARVILNHYMGEYEFPDFYMETVTEVDRIDSFDFSSLTDWRRETPGRIINCSLKSRFRTLAEEHRYFESVIARLAEKSLAEIASDADVAARYAEYLELEKRMLETIGSSSRFHPRDVKREYAIIDLTGHNRPMPVERNLAQILYPEIRAVFLVQALFDHGVKSTNFSISGSLTLKTGAASGKDIGEIMRVLNIGDGHAGAGSGQVFCKNKAEMEKAKEAMLDRVHSIWEKQGV